jgi:hypothetical protein
MQVRVRDRRREAAAAAAAAVWRVQLPWAEPSVRQLLDALAAEASGQGWPDIRQVNSIAAASVCAIVGKRCLLGPTGAMAACASR